MKYLLSSITVALFVFIHGAGAQQCVNSTANKQISANVLGSPLVIQTSSRFAGAISSMTWRGQQFVDSVDHGREFQTAIFLNGHVECYNPTEAGARSDTTTSSSCLKWITASGNVLRTRTQMAFYVPPGQTSESCTDGVPGTAVNQVKLSNYYLNKTVTIGFAGIPNVIEYVASIEIPNEQIANEGIYKAEVVIAAYMPRSFGWVRDYYVRNKMFSDVIRVPDYNYLDTGYGDKPVSLLNNSSHVGMTMYSPELLQPFNFVNPYLQWVMYPPSPGYPYPTSVFWGRFDGPASASTTITRRAYLVVGGYDEMQTALNQLHFYFRNCDPDVFNWQQYHAMNGDVAVAYPQLYGAEYHWCTWGINEGRSASYTFTPSIYLQKYSDIANYCGPYNYKCAIDHFVNYGRSEGRTGHW